MSSFKAAALLSIVSVAAAQQIGTYTPEQHPALTTYKCTLAAGCKAVNTSIVLEATTRWLHSTSGSESCRVGSAPLCDTAEACGKNCAWEGIDYSTRGIKTSGDILTLNQWRQDADGTTTTVSPRVYLLDEDGKNYVNMSLLDQELSFDVELSKLPCGMNGALYLSDMELDGGRSVSKGLNTAGAEYGTGYCDAQCPVQDWINGVANTERLGACCNEMDLWEANARAQAYTPHPCNATKIRTCSNDADCGQPEGFCDKWGCSYNPYSQGQHDFYGTGAGSKINTLQPFTVITQFHASAETGALDSINRLYIQNGTLIHNTATTVGGQQVDSVNNAYCSATATWTQQRGGLEAMGQALARGMVLIFSLWADDSGFMTWLDGGSSGPCNATEGDPREIVQHTPDASVTFSNIRWGEIGSTFKA